jgi:hypothetical protein
MSESSQQQIDANRENGKKGGVKTPEGKAITRYNALKHGFLSDKILMKGEKRAELEAMLQRLKSDLKPQSEVELLLVDRIVSNVWRLRRLLALEEKETRNTYNGGLDRDADLFFRYETMLERGIYKALHELQRLQAARKGEAVPLPVAVDVDISGEKPDGFVS